MNKEDIVKRLKEIIESDDKIIKQINFLIWDLEEELKKEEVKCIKPGRGGQSQTLIRQKMIKCQCPKHKHITKDRED